MSRCTAKAKGTGKRCKFPAVKDGNKCRYHGGLSLRGSASPTFKHGLYSKYAKKELADKVEEFRRREERLTDLLEVLALQHTLLAEALERDDLESARVISETISRNIERHHKVTGGTDMTVTIQDSFTQAYNEWQEELKREKVESQGSG
jgi:hypothetical protein